MIPYFSLPLIPSPLGPLDTFALFTILGSAVCVWVTLKVAKRDYPAQVRKLRQVAPWAIVTGFYSAHFLQIFAYQTEGFGQLTTGELIVKLLAFWHGMASTGGVVGILVAFVAYFRWRGWSLRPALDPLAMGFAPGWAVGRIACFLIHDHPGIPTDGPWAVDFPVDAYPGGPRHDLGLYEFLTLVIISSVLFSLARYRPRPGAIMGVFLVMYGCARFGLDFLRAYDGPLGEPRYAGLTPAQYIAILFVGAGVYLLASRPNTFATTRPATAAQQ